MSAHREHAHNPIPAMSRMASILLMSEDMKRPGRLLTLNCHEGWVYQLGYLDFDIDIIDGLPGRYCDQWDTRMRPVPRGAHLKRMEEILGSRPSYDCIVLHNITDLLDLRTLPGPRLLVIHETLEGRIRQHGLNMSPPQLRLLLQHYLELIGGHAMAVSPLKAQGWGFIADVVPNCVDIEAYLPWRGHVASGLRVANQISKRKEILLWEFHERLQGHSCADCGFQPDMSVVGPPRNWDELKSILSEYRFFIHTAHPELEDGYNNAMLEAMAAGLPVLGNLHPSSPIEHGVSGFLSDDPEELGRYAGRLLQDRELAGRMGEEARKRSPNSFRSESLWKGSKRPWRPPGQNGRSAEFQTITSRRRSPRRRGARLLKRLHNGFRRAFHGLSSLPHSGFERPPGTVPTAWNAGLV